MLDRSAPPPYVAIVSWPTKRGDPTPRPRVEHDGEALRAIRLQQPGRMARTVALAAEVDPGDYSRFENNRRVPSLDVADRIAEVLGVPTRTFFRVLDALQERDAGQERREVAACQKSA